MRSEAAMDGAPPITEQCLETTDVENNATAFPAGRTRPEGVHGFADTHGESSVDTPWRPGCDSGWADCTAIISMEKLVVPLE